MRRPIYILTYTVTVFQLRHNVVPEQPSILLRYATYIILSAILKQPPP